MAIHLTPTELAREAGMHRREVIMKCMELGVPIFEGRIDKTLFLASLKDAQRRASPPRSDHRGSTPSPFSVARDVESRRRPRAGAGR